jgi:hypothetical protein
MSGNIRRAVLEGSRPLELFKPGSELTPLRLEHIANDDPCSFRDEQASLGRALSACASADKDDFPFEAIHLSSIV